MHQAENVPKEITETTKIELRTVTWESSRKKCGQKKIWTCSDQWSFKRMMKSNHRKTTAELTATFNSESNTHTMKREVKWLGPHRCIAKRKTIITEAKSKKQPWTLEQWKKIMWSDETRVFLFQRDGSIRVHNKNASVNLTPTKCLFVSTLVSVKITFVTVLND